MEVKDENYQKEYDAAMEALEAGKPIPDSAEVKVEPEAKPEENPETEEQKGEPKDNTETKEEKVEPANAEPDPLAEIKQRLEKAEKVAQDNKSWGTKMAQEAAALRREKEQREREQNRPAILDANPDLADAVRFELENIAREQEYQRQNSPESVWQATIDRAFPGIFNEKFDPEFDAGLQAKLTGLGENVKDPLAVIGVITSEKLAFAERQVGKRFAAEAAKLSQKNAMSVPTGRAGQGRTQSTDADEVKRMQSMSDEEFQKEVRRVKGY